MRQAAKSPASRRGYEGQASVELILVLPVLLVVVAAVCQVALALNSYLVITAASREGARRGAETGSAEAAEKAALKSCSGLPGGSPSVVVDFPQGREKGDPVRVSVSYSVPLLVPGLENLLSGPTFRGSTSMALEKGE